LTPPTAGVFHPAAGDNFYLADAVCHELSGMAAALPAG